MLSELSRLEKNVGNHKDSRARLKEREDALIRHALNQPPSKMTRPELDQKRRAEMVADNTAKFGNTTIGIHGAEMPKFSEMKESKTWWKLQKDKDEGPAIQSATQLK